MNKMNIKNTYLGFTDNKKPMQKQRIEDTLDTLVRNNGELLYRKEFVFLKLIDGYLPSIEKNYSYYSVRLDDYTKPKTLYKLQADNGEYFEVTKTEHDFAKHVIDNNLDNIECANEYAKEEELRLKAQKEEEERINAEEQAAKKEEEERIEEESRKIREEKIRKWKEISEQYLTEEVKAIVHDVIEDNLNELDYDFQDGEKEQFHNDFNKNFVIDFGNIHSLIHNAKYLFSGDATDMLHNNIYKDIFRKVFHIEEKNHVNTINAKIKRFYSSEQRAV